MAMTPRRVSMLLVGLFFLTGCESGTEPVPVSSIQVTVPRTGIRVGETIQAAALTLDASGTVVTGRGVEWQSSNTAIASVSAGGAIKAESPGQVTISAISEGKTGTVNLNTSLVPVTEVLFEPAQLNLVVGGTGTFQVITKDSSGKVVTGRPIVWSVNNPIVASVAGGVVTAKQAGGTFVSADVDGRIARSANVFVTGN